MSKPKPLSGFPEWLPGQRLIEQHVVDKIRSTFELYGFAPLETRAVEPLDQLLRKGETSHEVYVLRRLQADADDSSDSGLGLHFDLTVPFARYVLENAGKLRFPYRRYPIPPSWRAERPQARACLALAEICTQDGSFADRVRALGVGDPLLDEGIAELTTVVETANGYAPGLVVADLRIARGLDYYTGTVYETELVGHEKL